MYVCVFSNNKFTRQPKPLTENSKLLRAVTSLRFCLLFGTENVRLVAYSLRPHTHTCFICGFVYNSIFEKYWLCTLKIISLVCWNETFLDLLLREDTFIFVDSSAVSVLYMFKCPGYNINITNTYLDKKFRYMLGE